VLAPSPPAYLGGVDAHNELRGLETRAPQRLLHGGQRLETVRDGLEALLAFAAGWTGGNGISRKVGGAA